MECQQSCSILQDIANAEKTQKTYVQTAQKKYKLLNYYLPKNIGILKWDLNQLSED